MRKVKYKVWYGKNTSYHPCYSLADVNAFVAHCLREGTDITAITRA